MGQKEGEHGGRSVASDFEEVEEVHEETKFEEFSDELKLAFPEDTVAYEDLFKDDPTATPSQSDDSPDQIRGEDGSPETITDDQPAQRESSESVSSSEQSDSLVAQLVTELEDDAASEQTIEQLRERLGVTSPQNVEVRLRHLQTQVSDLTAYIDALEAFLDNRGSAQQVLESVESEIEAIDVRLDDLERAHDTDHEQLHDQIATIEAELDAQNELLEEMEEIKRRVDTLESELETTDETVDTATDRIDALESDVSSALTTIKQHQSKLQEEVESVQKTHRQLKQAFTRSSQD